MPITDMKNFKWVITLVMEYLGDTPCWEPRKPTFKGILWENSGRSAKGVYWAWNEPDRKKNKPGLGYLSIGGSNFRGLKCQKVLKLCQMLRFRGGLKATRFDVALDDYDKSVTYDMVRDALYAGNVAHVRKDPEATGSIRRPVAQTLYIGQRSSDRLVRFYNKAIESKGKIDANRFEVQYRRDPANQAFTAYTDLDVKDCEELAPALLGAMVVGAVDFVDRSGGDRLARCPRLDWWQKFVDKFGQIRFTKTRSARTVDRLLNWLDRQVAPTLVMLYKGYGELGFLNYIRYLLKETEHRLTPWHETVITQLQKERRLGDEYALVA